ncbi:MAG TPA: chorismate synthase, partial [Lacipirellulaceae bacterium]|nr:chorismate synthase [Lacipirellulaceae bacterium]
MLRYWTAGESHGKTLIALVDGFPAGVTVDVEP